MRRSLTLLPALAIAGALASASGSSAGLSANTGAEHIKLLRTVDVSQIAGAPAVTSNRRPLHVTRHNPSSQSAQPQAQAVTPRAALGGANAPTSQVVSGGDNGNFNGISLIDMETGGTGNYANTNGGLEPPDQGLCVGNGYVMETVNDSLQIYSSGGTPLVAKSVPLSQFFAVKPNALTDTDFISDPRCYYDPTTQRWFVTELDLTAPAFAQFTRDNNYIAVSKTSNPLGAWYIYAFDVTDDGLMGSPLHAGCLGGPAHVTPGCLGDQPLIGVDASGVYISDNEYAFTQVFVIPPPVVPPFQLLPDVALRGGVGQIYALSKQQLETGTDTTLVRLDTSPIAFPGPTNDHPWQSLQPASPPPGDTTPHVPGGVEYFLSDVGLPLSPTISNQIVVWAWTGTDSLNTASPNLTLQHVVINTAAATDTFFVPDPTAPSSVPFFAYQKDGSHPRAAAAGDAEEVLNANDDRMNAPMLSNGSLWAGVNTQLPPANPAGTGHQTDPRVGIMYFQVTPSFNGPNLQAVVTRDGYISVPRNNVLFPSIGARPDGATVATFTLSGLDYFPSVAWARLDGLAPGAGPTVHISHAGAAPEDGFTGLGTAGQQGAPDVPPCTVCVARWGDYSYSAIDENGCIWGAAEYIPTGVADSKGAGDWGTAIHHTCPAPVVAAKVPPKVELPNTATPLPALGLLSIVLLAISLAVGSALLFGGLRRP